jgi:hypothetical protein
MTKEFKIELNGENKKIAERLGLTEWFPGIDELESVDDSMKDTVKELKDKGLEITGVYSGYQVTITKGKNTDNEEQFTGFGETVEEAVDSATPFESDKERK